MKIRFERALLTSRPQAGDKGTDRIYFGNEFCERLIPGVEVLKKAFSLADSGGKEFTFVTPFVTNAGLNRLEAPLEFLNSRRNVEVVFNDWGVLMLMRGRYTKLKPVLGRLLTKQRRDPRIAEIFFGKRKTREIFSADNKEKLIFFARSVPETLFEHYQGSVINLPAFQEFLLSQGVRRVEIDNLAWEMKVTVNKKIGVSVYLPYGYVTTSRMCGRLTMSYAACKKECQKYFLRLDDDSLPAPFYGIGNTVFYESRVPSDEYLSKLGIDRIVYQPRLPF